MIFKLKYHRYSNVKDENLIVLLIEKSVAIFDWAILNRYLSFIPFEALFKVSSNFYLHFNPFDHQQKRLFRIPKTKLNTCHSLFWRVSQRRSRLADFQNERKKPFTINILIPLDASDWRLSASSLFVALLRVKTLPSWPLLAWPVTSAHSGEQKGSLSRRSFILMQAVEWKPVYGCCKRGSSWN